MEIIRKYRKFWQLQIPPRVLINRNLKIVLFWNAKAGCTFAAKWFFFHHHAFEKAGKYRYKVHKFRTRKYYRSLEYQRSRLDFALHSNKYFVVKLVRNPFDRAVGSFIHAGKHNYIDQEISIFLNRTVHAESKFTFREYISFLETIDLQRCNIHHRIQTHPLESNALIHLNEVIKLDESFSGFEAIEEKFGLMKSNKELLFRSQHNSKRIRTITEFVGDMSYEKIKNNLPSSHLFYDGNIREAVKKLYLDDFLRYKF